MWEVAKVVVVVVVKVVVVVWSKITIEQKNVYLKESQPCEHGNSL